MTDYDKTKMEIELRNRQRAVNKKYAEDGLTATVLKEQVEINKLRHEYDIHDEVDIIFDDFVQ